MNFTRAEERRFAPERVRLPLVALIDVVMLLLIYFVLAGSLTPEETELPASLRTEKAGGKASDLLPQILIVEPGGGGAAAQFRIGERVLSDRAALASILKQLPKEAGVAVKVRPGVDVAAAAAALQACSDGGFTKVSYVPAK
ncbi:MAG: biopolymer transporter ExbD [Phycisphaerae bacterium]|nr:biopolymer transporter ExbD [Phycisphaerae bacterium]